MALISVICGALSHWERGRQRRAEAHAAGLPTPPDTPPDSPPPSPDAKVLKMHSVEEGTPYALHESPESSQAMLKLSGTGMAVPTAASQKPHFTRRGIILCVVAGLLFSGTAAFSTLAQKGSACAPPAPARDRCNTYDGLTPYGVLFYFSIGSFVVAMITLPALMLWPVNPTVSSMSPFGAYAILTWKEHLILIVAGMLSNFTCFFF